MSIGEHGSCIRMRKEPHFHRNRGVNQIQDPQICWKRTILGDVGVLTFDHNIMCAAVGGTVIGRHGSGAVWQILQIDDLHGPALIDGIGVIQVRLNIL
jgi:hypothetical protein